MFGAQRLLLARCGDGLLERVVADGAVHHPIADHEQRRARRTELTRQLEVPLELGWIARSSVGAAGIPTAWAAVAIVSSAGRPAPHKASWNWAKRPSSDA